jgi:hypothetical protein
MLQNIIYLHVCHVTVVIDFLKMFNIDCGTQVLIKIIFCPIEQDMSVLIVFSIG